MRQLSQNTKSWFNRFLVVALILPLLSTFIPQKVEAATSISLFSGVKVSLYNAQLVQDEAGKIAAYTILINNESSSTVELIDYWAKIVSGNKNYSTKLISEDMQKKIVLPNNSTYLTYYAYVGQTDTLSSLSLDMIEWDFSASNYERVIGKLKVNNDGSTAYTKSKEINLGNSLFNVIVANYKMYSDKEYKYVTINLAARNKMNSTVEAANMKFFLSDGKNLVQLSTSSKTTQFLPQERKSLVLSTVLNKDFAEDNVSVVVMLQDGEQNAQNIPMAQLKLPKLVNTAATASNTKTSYQFGDASIGVTLKSSVFNYADQKATVSSEIELENNGTKSVEVPSFEYYIKSPDGFLYPMITEGEVGNLLPKIKKQINIQGEVPSGIDISKSEFVLYWNDGESSFYLGNYKLAMGNQTAPPTGASQKVTYNQQEIEQISMQRIPNGNSDLLVAEFKITNKASTAKPKIAVTGQFALDGVELSSEQTKVVQLDRLLAISPNQSYRVVTYTEIPYVQAAKEIVFKMQEVGKGNLHQFKLSELSKAKLLGSNQSYVIDTVGQRANISLKQANTYTGSQKDLFMVEFLYENKELRNNDITTLNGYIENSKGEIVNLTIEKADKKILPNGKAVIYAYGEVPKSFESQRVNIYVGESVPSESEEELTNVMVNSVQFQHLVKETKPLDSVREFVFGQYDIKLTGILGILGSSDGFTPDKVDLNFDYNINLVDGAPEYVADQQLVFEYVDKNVKSVKFSKAFKLGGTDENSLQIGSSQTATISYTHPSLAYIGLGEFDLNVYHQYKGYKKLIATQTMNFGSN